jgi:6-phosphogluconolactonase
VPVELASAEAAAARYEGELKEFFRDSQTAFDVIVLGMGSDGHMASLFPGAPALEERNRWVLGVDGAQGQPPVPRVTLTLPAINAGRAALFLVSGSAKRDLVEAAAEGGGDFPAARVRPRERLLWFYADP